MQQVVVPNTTLLAALAELSGAGNLYNGAVMRLYKTPAALSPLTLLADLTEADFTGYSASAAVVWSAPAYLLPSGQPTLIGDLKVFAAGSPVTVGNTIYGWYLTNAAGTVLLFARAFESPVSVSAPSQVVDVLPMIPAASVL